MSRQSDVRALDRVPDDGLQVGCEKKSAYSASMPAALMTLPPLLRLDLLELDQSVGRGGEGFGAAGAEEGLGGRALGAGDQQRIQLLDHSGRCLRRHVGGEQ